MDPSSADFRSHRGRVKPDLSQIHEQDVNGDGLPDLVCEFRTHSTGLSLDDREAVLKGATTDGAAIVGANAILPV